MQWFQGTLGVVSDENSSLENTAGSGRKKGIVSISRTAEIIINLVDSIGLYLSGYNLSEYETILRRYTLPQAMKFFRLFILNDESKAVIENQKREFIAAIHGCKIELKNKTVEKGGWTEDEKLVFEYGEYADWVKKESKRK